MQDDESASDPAAAAYADAKRFAKEGAFAEALERHEWFHEHALTYQPSYFYGVRLSFALSAWAELGAKYPPALASLRQIRDRDTELVRLPGSSDSLFHDVVAINRALGDNRATMILFREIEHAWPELARRRFRFISEEAFNTDGELFVRYTLDLVSYGQQLRDRCQDMRVRVSRLPKHLLSEPKFTGAQARLHLKFNQDLRAAIQRLAALAASAGQGEASKRIMNLVRDTEEDDHGLTA